jgi:hypothetical protein
LSEATKRTRALESERRDAHAVLLRSAVFLVLLVVLLLLLLMRRRRMEEEEELRLFPCWRSARCWRCRCWRRIRRRDRTNAVPNSTSREKEGKVENSTILLETGI